MSTQRLTIWNIMVFLSSLSLLHFGLMKQKGQQHKSLPRMRHLRTIFSTCRRALTD